MTATETSETFWLIAGPTLLALLALMAAVILAERSQRSRIDRLIHRLEKLEARWGEEARVEAPNAPAAGGNVPAPRLAGEGAPQGDVLAGWTSHVRHVVEGDSADTVGLADQAIAGIHCRLNASLTPSDLAAALCVSLRTLERGLAATLDCTPSQLILAMKMREARRMLQSGHYRVGEVADRLGFSSQFHFSRRFKAYYRVPPSELRDTGRGDR